MEISFHGRGARAGRNNNLLTSHVMRRVILHPPTRSATSPPFARLFEPGRLAAYTAADRVSRNCHLSSRRFTVPFTPPAIPDRPRASRSFERFISARSLVYPRRRQRGTGRSFYRSRYLLADPPRSTSHFTPRERELTLSPVYGFFSPILRRSLRL